MMRRTWLAPLWMIAAAGPAAAVEIDAAPLFAQYDRDGNGRITTDEMAGTQAGLFRRMVRVGDADGDGALAPDELAAALTPVRSERPLVEKQGSRLPGADALVVILAMLDGDGDGQLAADETPPRLRATFTAMLQRGDANRDGVLQRREIVQAAGPLSAVAQIAVRRLGLDVEAELARLTPAQRGRFDGPATLPDLGQLLADPGAAAELFARLDADGDGSLATDEAPPGLAAARRRSVERGGVHSMGGGGRRPSPVPTRCGQPPTAAAIA